MAEQTPTRRPTRADAERAVVGLGECWRHPDPAGVCPLVYRTGGRVHVKRSAAVSCEWNSQEIAWKRAKARGR